MPQGHKEYVRPQRSRASQSIRCFSAMTQDVLESSCALGESPHLESLLEVEPL